MITADLVEDIKSNIREIPDFPKPGILFKDITPLLLNQELCDRIVNDLLRPYQNTTVDAIAAIESRGFLFGILMANQLRVPFIPLRKKGRLPGKVMSASYHLEYGEATIEMIEGVVQERMNILIHDDLLATGGTAGAAAELVKLAGGKVAGYSFVVELDFLKGRKAISNESNNIYSIVHY